MEDGRAVVVDVGEVPGAVHAGVDWFVGRGFGWDGAGGGFLGADFAVHGCSPKFKGAFDIKYLSKFFPDKL